ncbi:uncharacterized protein K460DRAFT_350846 [Cucurbitaria berberidis CBS 394.84]|uniref:Aminoglycoside phosphotransferase domain-containing protein n=1 Tax=Cucurbitaria berberidis CBS 394.84 TaxID=1168544 RepID=A0A9P4GTM2_9PLEO|nr:uncharacterized protein K460DRAFT_350846 [Cucurbitaria berberidis CBS 394.84]KAF1850841.1 hypothetical protein K460DRAFT_350846 [Cucurbitaria berberidis CBS 394.84]
MPHHETSSLKSYFDEIAETNGDNECRAWLNRLFDNKAEIADCVSHLLERGPGTYVGFLKGSFNFSFRIRFREGFPDALIRFPKPGHTATALRDEKVENEVRTMDYLRQHTTIPLPAVHEWGTTATATTKTAAKNLLRFGPFIIMDYVEGTLLSTILKQPDQEDMILNPNFDKTILDKIYRQIADYMLQFSQLRFTRIGAISKDDHANWYIRRPLTYNMNELATVAFYPGDRFPTAPMDSASDYFSLVANEHLNHLWTQRNLADNQEIAQKRFIARHQFAQLIPKYCIHDTGPFIPFCDDLRPGNMLVNPETLQITVVFDFEFTNSMPAQFAYDPPWWLLLSGLETWLDRCALQEFLALYEPRMEQFLRTLEHVEAESLIRQPSAPPLSARMRDSWRTRRFWFNYAARKSFEVDSIYWATLHDDSATVLDAQACAEMESLTQRKMDQLKAYKEECSARFS